MKYTRRTAIAALGAATAAVAVPSSARAGTAPRIWSCSNLAEDFGRLGIAAACASPITDFKVHVLTRAGAAVATVEGFDLHSGTALDGVWRARERLVLPELELYRLDVEAWSADGGYVRSENVYPGLLYFLRDNFVDVTVTPEVVDFRDDVVTLSGRYLPIPPATNVPEPMAGVRMAISVRQPEVYEGNFDVQAVTDAEGWFRADLTLRGAATVGVGTYGDPPFVYHTGKSLTVAQRQTATRLRAELSRMLVARGGTVELSGLLERQVDGAWEPFTGQQLEVSWGATLVGGGLVTDGQGRFTAKYQPAVESGECVVRFNPPGTLFARTSTSITGFRTLLPIEIVDFAATWRPRPPYDVSSWVIEGFVAYRDGRSPSWTDVEVQVSANGVDGWKSVATLRAQWGGDLRGFPFKKVVRLPGGCHVRVYVAMTDWFLATASATRYIPPSRRTRFPVELGPA